MKYLLDTDICIYYMNGKFELKKRFEKTMPENCMISEITLAELKFGVENSVNKEKNNKVLSQFLSGIQVLPIYHSIDLYAKEKSRLRKNGITVDEFDLFIGVTSITHQLTMVTHNTSHYKSLKGIVLEDWVQD